MALVDIPIKHLPTRDIEIDGLGFAGAALTTGQMALVIGASVASTALTVGAQYLMARDAKKQQEKRIKEEEARAARAAQEAREYDKKVREEQARLQQHMMRMQQAHAIMEMQAKQRQQKTLLTIAIIGSISILGSIALLTLTRTKKPAASSPATT